MKRQLIPVIVFMLMPMWSGAQTVESFRLPKNYIGRLDEILTELGGDLNIRFIFDKATLQQYNTSLMMDNEKQSEEF